MILEKGLVGEMRLMLVSCRFLWMKELILGPCFCFGDLWKSWCSGKIWNDLWICAVLGEQYAILATKMKRNGAGTFFTESLRGLNSCITVLQLDEQCWTGRGNSTPFSFWPTVAHPMHHYQQCNFSPNYTTTILATQWCTNKSAITFLTHVFCQQQNRGFNILILSHFPS